MPRVWIRSWLARRLTGPCSGGNFHKPHSFSSGGQACNTNLLIWSHSTSHSRQHRQQEGPGSVLISVSRIFADPVNTSARSLPWTPAFTSGKHACDAFQLTHCDGWFAVCMSSLTFTRVLRELLTKIACHLTIQLPIDINIESTECVGHVKKKQKRMMHAVREKPFGLFSSIKFQHRAQT